MRTSVWCKRSQGILDYIAQVGKSSNDIRLATYKPPYPTNEWLPSLWRRELTRKFQVTLLFMLTFQFLVCSTTVIAMEYMPPILGCLAWTQLNKYFLIPLRRIPFPWIKSTLLFFYFVGLNFWRYAGVLIICIAIY